MRNFLLYFFLLIGVFSSCKKEELNGDLAYLEGKWKLSLIFNSPGSWTGPPQEQDVCYLEFQHSGKIIFSDANGKVTERGRIVSFTSRPAYFYPDGIYYELKIKSNALFNKNLTKITSMTLVSTITQPMEFITNDIKYETNNGEIELLFRKM